MKTIKEWLKSVENPILRKVLLMRYDEKFVQINLYKDSLADSILSAFQWNLTVESYDFWENVYDDLINSNESQTFNAKYPVMQIEWLDENECIHCETEEEAYQIGKLVNSETTPEKDMCYYRNGSVYYISRIHFNHQTYPAKLFIKQENKMENLLEEAKKRYPIGCRFKDCISAIAQESWGTGVNNLKQDPNIRIICQVKSEYGVATSHVYYNSKWAEYIEVFGFKVGDVVDVNILEKWCTQNNNWLNSKTNKWCTNNSNLSELVDGNILEITKIQYINDAISFTFNSKGCIKLCVKAEGLREFINSKQKQMKTLTELPEYFVVKQDESNPLWQKYIDWLNKTYHNDHTGCKQAYYGFDGRRSSCCFFNIENFNNNPTIITLEQWNSIVNKPKFEVGKWYRLKYHKTSYGRCSNSILKSNYMDYDALISNGNFSNQKGSCDTRDDRLELIIDLSEIQQYLLNGHVDKWFTIENLSEGKCAVINDGTVEELQLVLNTAFPKDDCCWENKKIRNQIMSYKYVVKHKSEDGLWDTTVVEPIIPTQSVKLFIKQLQNENFTNMQVQILTLGQLKSLYKLDTCKEWQSIISDYIAKSYLLYDECKINIEQKDIEYAQKHCNKKQLQLLKDAGLKFEEECPYKIGDWVVVTCPGKQYIEQIETISINPLYITTKNALAGIDNNIRLATLEEIKYAQIEWDKLKTGSVVKIKLTDNVCGNKTEGFNYNKPFDIVYYNTLHCIFENHFLKKALLDKYITVHQTGKFLAFNATNTIDFISEVISY